MAIWTKTKNKAGVQRAVKQKSELELSPKQLFKINHRRGELQVKVVAGEIWLTTVTHDGQDYVLRAGEKVTVRSRGLVVLEALSGARVQVG